MYAESGSDHRNFHQSVQYMLPHGGHADCALHQSTQMVVRWCIPPVNIVGGQMVYSTSQHSTTWWSDGASHQSTHLVVRWCIPPVNTVPHGDQIVHSTSQHTWWSDGAFHQSTQYYMVIRLCIPPVPQYHMVVRLCIPLVSTVGGRLCIPSANTIQHGGQTMHSTN